MVVEGEHAAAKYGCLRCHTLDGSIHIGPTWVGLYGSKRLFTDGTTRIADEAYLTESMMDPAEHIVAGFKPVMPTYQGILEPGETAAIVELIRSLANGPIGIPVAPAETIAGVPANVPTTLPASLPASVPESLPASAPATSAPTSQPGSMP